MPYISIVIPIYNSEKTIERCLISVSNSTYKDYELIVVDDYSSDSSNSISKKYADKMITLKKKAGRICARNAGVNASSGNIVVFTDSDILIREDTLSIIADFFQQHPDVDAVNGLISKRDPGNGFFTQYKNLYMNYIFMKLPDDITFLNGSICAFRRSAAVECPLDLKADDTQRGQIMFSSGKKIVLLKSLEVNHLKEYGLFSLLKNDFEIPLDWARIFVKFRGWEQLGKNGTGYAHSPKEQLISVILAPSVFFFAALSSAIPLILPAAIICFFVWFALNIRFFRFLAEEKGRSFEVIAIFFTFIDNMVMSLGIVSGFIASLCNAGERKTYGQ